MLPPLAIACAAGLGGRPTKLGIPLCLSANGNSIALTSALEPDFLGVENRPLAAASALAIAVRKRGRKLRLAVVHAYSTHDLLLRYWLAVNGNAPASVADITVLPPAEMVGSLAAGAIDGFCAGLPWADVASHAGLGFVGVRTAAIWRNHPEKCLALRESFIDAAPGATLA